MATPPSDDLIGTVAAGYRIIGHLGSGTMGHVYEAEDTKSGRRVALKVLHRHHQKELAPRFLREGKTLALLSHPNIVQLVDMGQLEDGALYLATERVPGESLRELMDRGPVEQRRALMIVRQLLAALDAAHELGVVHRDIKPENIMLAPGDQGDLVKVLDFGVAKLLQDTVAGLGEANLTTIGFSIFGSALYIAPESATGQPVDARIDLYSVGALLYELLTGRPPFDHEDPTVILRMHAFDPAPTLRDAAPANAFTPQLEALVGKALAKRPDDRFRDAADMLLALDEALQSLAPAIPAASQAAVQAAQSTESRDAAVARAASMQRAPTQSVGPSRRHMLVIGGAATVGVIAVVVLFLGSVGGRSNAAPTALVARAKEAPLAQRADSLVMAGQQREAVELIEQELTERTQPAHPRSYLVLGHARFALGDRLQALGAYERALRLLPALGSDTTLRANLLSVLESREPLAVVLALELLSQLVPPEHGAIAGYASEGKLLDGRRRATMIAERDGVTDRIDRVASWTLDLQQVASCDERKQTIAQLAATADRRALGALKRARGVKCLEREATAAIAKMQAAN